VRNLTILCTCFNLSGNLWFRHFSAMDGPSDTQVTTPAEELIIENIFQRYRIQFCRDPYDPPSLCAAIDSRANKHVIQRLLHERENQAWGEAHILETTALGLAVLRLEHPDIPRLLAERLPYSTNCILPIMPYPRELEFISHCDTWPPFWHSKRVVRGSPFAYLCCLEPGNQHVSASP
jgi:hypothetical protein